MQIQIAYIGRSYGWINFKTEQTQGKYNREIKIWENYRKMAEDYYYFG